VSKAHDPGIWDGIADKYDGLRPDQGLTDPDVRAAWAALLATHLPEGKCRILDAGCGTGSLSLLLAEAGHDVAGIDFAPEMIAVAERKAQASGLPVAFDVADAATPDFPPATFDAIVCRQTLWALPDRTAALENWSRLLMAHGRLILIEGKFASGNGLSETEVRAAMPARYTTPEVTDISRDEALWGGPIPDQRLLITAARVSA